MLHIRRCKFDFSLICVLIALLRMDYLYKYEYRAETLSKTISVGVVVSARFPVLIGVVLAFLEKAGAIPPAERDDGSLIPSGIVSAGYQNFILCIEMLLASFALRFAFPVGIYRRELPTCSLPIAILGLQCPIYATNETILGVLRYHLYKTINL